VKIRDEPTGHTWIGHPTGPSGIPYSFTVANNYLYASNPYDTFKWSPAHGVQNWGIQGMAGYPVVTLITGSLTATKGYQYVVTYVNSTSGHESSPSAPSVTTGPFTAKNMTIAWGTPVDPQVDFVNIYRTPDGGAANPQEMGLVAQVLVGSSPYTDSAPDSALSAVQFAPGFYVNDPPPQMLSIVSYAGRIWGAIGVKVWFSGQEEISNGVPQESFPGASINSPAGNFFAYETEPTALAPLTDGVAVFVPGRIQKIEGDSLDTFRRYTLLAKRGTVTDFTVKVVGNSVLWFDRSHQLWLSDQGEIGRDIRPDMSMATLTTAQAAIHIAGEQHWICFLDPDNKLLYVYDLDIGGWNVPWSVAGTCIESIDVASGVTRLAVAINGHVLLENPGIYLDQTTQYDAFAVTNPVSLSPENNPDFVANLHHIAIESNEFQPLTVSVKTDEDPGRLTENNIAIRGGGFNPLNTVNDPPMRRNGIYLIQKNYMGSPDPAAPACRRLAVRIDWRQPEPALWALYSIDFAMTPVGN
jgi:hypothetical protein